MALLLTLMLLAPFAAESEPTFAIETLAGSVVVGEPLLIEGETLRVRLGPARDREIPLDELLIMTGAAADPAVAGASDLLVLAGRDGATGDRLWGQLVGGGTFGVLFQLENAVPVEIPFERIERLLPAVSRPVDQLARLEGADMDDRVWRPLPGGGLDGVSGVVDRVENGTVVLDSALGSLDFPVDELLAVVFGATEGPSGELGGVPVVVRLAGGSRLTAGLLELGAGRIVLQTHFAERLELPLAAVRSLVSRGDRVALLADMIPLEVEEWPTIGTPDDVLFGWRRDLSVSGRVLSVAGIPRATGLGVHAHARLVYAMPPDAMRMRVGVGLVDEVSELPATGTVTFEVKLDGETRAQSGLVTEGDGVQVLRVDGLAGVQRLELLVGDGGDDDAGDRAAWFDGVILLGGRKP